MDETFNVGDLVRHRVTGNKGTVKARNADGTLDVKFSSCGDPTACFPKYLELVEAAAPSGPPACTKCGTVNEYQTGPFVCCGCRMFAEASGYEKPKPERPTVTIEFGDDLLVKPLNDRRLSFADKLQALRNQLGATSAPKYVSIPWNQSIKVSP